MSGRGVRWGALLDLADELADELHRAPETNQQRSDT